MVTANKKTIASGTSAKPRTRQRPVASGDVAPVQTPAPRPVKRRAQSPVVIVRTKARESDKEKP